MKNGVRNRVGRMSRRRFLRSASIGAAVSAGAAATPPFVLAAQAGMFRGFRPPELFRKIREAGYRFVELGGGQIRAAAESEKDAKRLLDQMGEEGVSPVSAFVVRRIAAEDESERRRAVSQWKQSLDGVRRLGLKHIGTELTGNVAKREAGERAFRKSMEELLPILEQAGIELSAEPHPGDFFEDARSTLAMIRGFGSKNLTYLHCTPHTFYLGESVGEVIEDAGELLKYVHVSDSFRTERIMDRFGGGVGLHLHLRPGLGEVDFGETFEALQGIGYRGFVSVQAISHPDRPVEAARKSREYLESLLGARLMV